MSKEKDVITCKVVLLGESGVGKQVLFKDILIIYLIHQYHQQEEPILYRKQCILKKKNKILGSKYGIQRDKKNIVL